MSEPTISVVIPAYNARRTILATLESVLAQTLTPLEVIVVDDGSTDDTAALVEAMPPPVRLLRKPNGGPAAARNLGARAARGDWLAFLDSDDTWPPEKLRLQIKHITAPDIGLINSPASHFTFEVPDEVDFETLWEMNVIANSSVLLRRSVFDQLDGFDERRELISAEDYNMWLRVAAAGWRIRTCQFPTIHYTRGEGLSSHLERFTKAQVANIRTVGERLGLPRAKVAAKIARILHDAGMQALFARSMRTARAFFRDAWRTRPSAATAAGYLIALLPPGVLNARRRLLGWLGRDSSPDLPLQDSVFIDFKAAQPIRWTEDHPTLLVIVDAEEEFDWEQTPSTSMQVDSIRSQALAQKIYKRHGVVPTYAVDYAVASQPAGYLPLRAFLDAGECEIGAQLHPWINPPIEEELNERHSFPGNLPGQLELRKMKVLTDAIRQNFGRQPMLYRAGRYGAGRETVRHLRNLGYRIDSTVRPYYDLRPFGGPDFTRSPSHPCWCDRERTLLEIPFTVGMLGLLARHGRALYPILSSRMANRLYLQPLAARLNLLHRTSITPEGVPLEEAKELTRRMLADEPNAVIVLSYHSSSLEPGNTPYVRTDKDLRDFLRWIEEYLAFFFTECKGKSSTPMQVFERARQLDTAPVER